MAIDWAGCLQTTKPKWSAFFGQPVAENPTGVMQEAGFAAAGLNWRYLNFEVPPERLGAAMDAMDALGNARYQPDDFRTRWQSSSTSTNWHRRRVQLAR